MSDRLPSYEVRTPSVKPISAADIAVLIALPALTCFAWLCPARSWQWICRGLAPIAAHFLSRQGLSPVQRVQQRLGDRRLSSAADMITREALAGRIEQSLQILRDYRPGGWWPPIRLVGVEHIEAARNQSKGAILWDSNFASNGLVTKMALHRAGIAVSHLSSVGHGFTSTRFGMLVLNRVWTTIEERYLRERAVLSLEGPVAAMRLLYRRLRDNGIVSISVHSAAQTPLKVPFLNGTVTIATGAPDLAYATGAPVLPVFTVRDATGTFVVTVEPPLDIVEGASRRESSERVVRRYVERLAHYVVRHPGQWLGWLDP